LNARRERWLGFLYEFSFKIKHIKGKENRVADAWNSKMHVMHMTTINICKSDLKSRVVESLVVDEHYVQVKDGSIER
jgi:ribosomal protein S24E